MFPECTLACRQVMYINDVDVSGVASMEEIRRIFRAEQRRDPTEIKIVVEPEGIQDDVEPPLDMAQGESGGAASEEGVAHDGTSPKPFVPSHCEECGA